MTSFNEQRRRDAIDDAVEALLERQRLDRNPNWVSMNSAINEATPRQIEEARRQVFAEMEADYRRRSGTTARSTTTAATPRATPTPTRRARRDEASLDRILRRVGIPTASRGLVIERLALSKVGDVFRFGEVEVCATERGCEVRRGKERRSTIPTSVTSSRRR